MAQILSGDGKCSRDGRDACDCFYSFQNHPCQMLMSYSVRHELRFMRRSCHVI